MDLFKNKWIRIIIKLSAAFAISFLAGGIIEKFILFDKPFSKSRFLAFFSITLVISVAFLFYEYFKGIIEFIIKKRYIIAGVIFILLVALKLHGSSIGMWDSYLQDKIDVSKKTEVFGISRAIRSDEWLFQTPIYLSQVNSNPPFQLNNENIADGQNMLPMAGSPVLHTSMLARPYVWGFILFGAEYGLSWFWWSKLILLFLLSFELCYIITRRNKILSVLGAVMIAFSPPVQWWFSNGFPEAIICSFGLIVCCWYYINNPSNKLKKILLLVGFTFSALGFTLPIYPTWQIFFGIFAFITIISMLIINRKNLKFGKFEIIGIGFCILFVFLIGANFIKDCYQSILTTINTVYPGKRIMLGGDFEFSRFFSIMYNWLMPFQDTSSIKGLTNTCELSVAFSFFPLSFFGMLAAFKKDRKNSVISGVWLFYYLFLTSWLFITFPALYAKLTLLSYATANRLVIVSSIIAVLLDIFVINFIAKHKPFNFIQSILISLLFVILCAAFINKSAISVYLATNKINILIIIIIVFILSMLYLLGKYKIFAFIVALVVLLSGIVINPISRGLDSIYNKYTIQKILEIKSQTPDSKWASTNSIIYGNLIVALGIDSINCGHLYPNLNLWKSLDKNNKYESVYNRYGYVQINIADEITFENPQQDVILVNLPLSELNNLNIDYILSKGKLEQSDDKIKLEQIFYNNLDDLYIYKLVDTVS